MSKWDELLLFVCRNLDKFGEISIHDTDPLTFTVTSTEDKQKLEVIREYAKTYFEPNCDGRQVYWCRDCEDIKLCTVFWKIRGVLGDE